jgi:putative peptidoglycan lipid II flippase
MRFLSGTIISRLTGLLRDVVLASAFGTGFAFSSFLVAYRLAHFCRRLFGEGAMQSAFIPVFEEYRKDSEERAFRFFRNLTATLTLFLIAFVVVSILALAASLYIIPWSEPHRYIVKLTMIFMPSLIPICLFGINSSLLQCQKHYFTPGIAPAAFNIVITLGALTLGHLDALDAMPYLSAFAVLACAAQWLVTLSTTWKQVRLILKEKLHNAVELLSIDIKRFTGPLLLGFLGVGASQINNTVDVLFAMAADPQGPAQLWFAIHVLQLPLALFGIALSGALLPPLSRAIQAGNREQYGHFLEFAFRRMTAFLLPCAVVLYVFGTHIINLVYGRGHFDGNSIYMTTCCVHGYAFGLLPMGFIIVLASACYARKDFRTPTIGAILSLCTNLILNSIMVYGLGWKAMSVALATSISAWINCIFIYVMLKRNAGPVLSIEGVRQFSKIIFTCLAAGVITWFLQNHFLTPATIFGLEPAGGQILPSEFFGQVMALLIPALLYICTFFLVAWLIAAEDIFAIFKIAPPEKESTVNLEP